VPTGARQRSREKPAVQEDDVLDGGDEVPGWTLPVRSLFA
jgi:hypothetical protein